MPGSLPRPWRSLSLRSLVVAVLLVVPALASVSTPAQAADLSQFKPGNIISDAVFFNPSTMTEADVQAFLNARGRPCSSGAICLRSYVDVMPARAADAYCAGYAASGPEAAARIIVRVAQSCGVNPQVLLVMLQKEQGLITATAPSQATYNKAMGFGCPDGQDCNTLFSGFANQVWNAARQFQVYATSGRFTSIKIGQVNQVRYHPNAACGTGPVLIENRATAGLYYYTPYQPNAAALAAGYGTGDACSAYGNRNFYNYFTDWFGGTQSGGSLVQAPGDPRVWLVTPTAKHFVRDFSDLLVLASRLGWVTPTGSAYLNSLPTGGDITRYVHDPRSGTLFLLQADGTKHRFLTADQIAQYGYAFPSYVNLSGAQIDAFATGPEVGSLFRIEQAPEVFQVVGRTRRYITTPAAAAQAVAGGNSYVASMASSSAAQLTAGPSLLPRRTLVRGASSGTVYLTLDDSRLLAIPSFGLAADAGVTDYRVFPDGVLDANPIVPGRLSPLITCGSTSLLLSGGQGRPIADPSALGLTATALPDAACADLPRGAAVSSPVFVQVPGRPEAYVLNDGRLHHVRTIEQLRLLLGNRPLTILPWTAETAAGVSVGAPVLGARSFVQFAGRPEVYLGDGRTLRHVTSYAVLLREGGGRVPPIEAMPAEWFSYYAVGAPLN